MIEIQGVIMAAVTSAVYSLIVYSKKRAKDDPEPFNIYKLGATVLVGAGVGISMELSSIQLSQQSVETQVAAYAGTVAIVESLLKSSYRNYLQYIPDYVSQLK
jgi:hypothetical protein